jgi:hypothetical protein
MDIDNSGTLSLHELTTGLIASRAIASGDFDLASAYATICVQSSHGRGAELTYHEYIAATISTRSRIDINTKLCEMTAFVVTVVWKLMSRGL